MYFHLIQKSYFCPLFQSTTRTQNIRNLQLFLQNLVGFYTKTTGTKSVEYNGIAIWDCEGFPGGAVVKNPPANAGDTGSSPGLGRSHMPGSS